MFGKKDLKEKIDEAKHKQYLIDKKFHEDAVNKIWKTHNRQLDKIHNDYRIEIEKIHKNHNNELKKKEKERIRKYEEALMGRSVRINELKDEIAVFKGKLKDYEAAYDLYKTLREHLVQMSRKMKQSADKVKASSAEIYQAFSELEDLSDFHLMKMKRLEPEIENKMLDVNCEDKFVQLKVVTAKKEG